MTIVDKFWKREAQPQSTSDFMYLYAVGKTPIDWEIWKHNTLNQYILVSKEGIQQLTENEVRDQIGENGTLLEY